jgi:hypothetical protein
MNAAAVRRIAWLLIALFATASVSPPADAGKIFGRGRCHKLVAKRGCCPPVKCCPSYGGCLCVKYWLMDAGETDIYYAHEHDECTWDQCPNPNPVWIYGEDLIENQMCPYTCYEMRCVKQTTSGQPKLDRPRPELFNLYLPGDPDIRLNPWLIKIPQGHRTGIMRHPDDGRPIYVKVFSIRVRSLTVTSDVCVGVEVESVSNVQFDVAGQRLGGLDYVYEVPIGAGLPCAVIASQ